MIFNGNIFNGFITFSFITICASVQIWHIKQELILSLLTLFRKLPYGTLWHFRYAI